MRERLGAEHYGEERAETTMTVGWIAARLGMGTRGYLNHLLYRQRKLRPKYPISRTDPCDGTDPFPHLLYWEKRKKTEAKYKAYYQEPTPSTTP